MRMRIRANSRPVGRRIEILGWVAFRRVSTDVDTSRSSTGSVSTQVDTWPEATQPRTRVLASLHEREVRGPRARPGRFLVLALTTATCALFLAGCHVDMWIEPKVHKPLQASDFFVDAQSARPLVPGAVAHEPVFDTDSALHTGMENGKLVDAFPFPMTREDLER